MKLLLTLVRLIGFLGDLLVVSRQRSSGLLMLPYLQLTHERRCKLHAIVSYVLHQPDSHVSGPAHLPEPSGLSAGHIPGAVLQLHIDLIAGQDEYGNRKSQRIYFAPPRDGFLSIC
jgi:hypothetical protein